MIQDISYQQYLMVEKQYYHKLQVARYTPSSVFIGISPSILLGVYPRIHLYLASGDIPRLFAIEHNISFEKNE